MRCFLIFFSVVFFSCRGTAGLEEYLLTVDRNEDFHQSVEKEEYIYTCNFIPAEFLAIKEVTPEAITKRSISQTQYETAAAKFSEAFYFNLKIIPRSGEDILKRRSNGLAQYTALTQYLTENFGKQVSIFSSEGEEITCLRHQFLRSFGASPELSFMIVFPRRSLKDAPFDILLEDNITSDTKHQIRFAFDGRELSKPAPRIKEIL
jgi:hypothetical protein